MTESGRMTAIAVACALCSSVLLKYSKAGTMIVPPPDPNNPLMNPETIPIIVVFNGNYPFKFNSLLVFTKNQNY